MGIYIGIFFRGKRIDIVFRKVPMDAGCLCQINCLVVGNGSFFFFGVGADDEIAVDVDHGAVFDQSLVLILQNTMVAVDDDQIGIAEIKLVAIGKLESSSGNCVGLNAIAG